ncbi:MAG: AAA family ATPase [Rhizobium sp.]|nr:AAA family ATPase [Rhizobium sp.]
MRIARLDLLRFGKFTDQSVSLPLNTRDFHLIVGPNEAGKSTLRSAVLDLLFGIETRSPYNFQHPHNEMRLGALVEHDGKSLDFVRIKARTKTLRDPSGVPLPDNALSGLMGTMERGFFDQMFGLDHELLVSGGREILNASNDIGQILFQSAAGIGSLGTVRDALEREADSLWAKRHSSSREYHAASDELEKAEAALKLATVRTKEWVTARNLVDQHEEALKEAREHYRFLEQNRARLDRIRRVAPLITALLEHEQKLAQLGQIVDLPSDAGAQLIQAEQAIATANQQKKFHSERVEKLEGRIGDINVDEMLILRSAEIQALSEQHQLLRNHPGDIVKRQEELNGRWKTVQDLAHQLGWAIENEESVTQRIPSHLVRSGINALIRKHDVVTQALETAVKEQTSRQSDCDVTEEQLKTLPTIEVPMTLHAALTTARALGDTIAQEKRLASQVTRAQRELDGAKLALGNWDKDIEVLRTLQLPSQEEVGSLQQHQTNLEAEAKKFTDRIAEVQSNLSDLALEITQYQDKHHPVTLVELLQVRGQRDELWHQIKTGAVAPIAVGPAYEARVVDADGLSDKRHDKAHEVSELQAKLDQKERMEQQLRDLETRQDENSKLQSEFDVAWEARVSSLGLSGMPLLQLNAWRSARERVIVAAEAVAEAHQAQTELREDVSRASTALVNELRDLIEGADSLPLAMLISHATELVEVVGRAEEQRKALVAQRSRAQRALADSEKTVSKAKDDVSAWETDWRTKLGQSYLPVEADPGTVQGALTLFDQIDDGLRQIRELRTNRIGSMQRDLDSFHNKARKLAADVAPELLDRPTEDVAGVLTQRLSVATEAAKERKRLQAELDEALGQLSAAESAINTAKAALDPLLHLAAVADNDELRQAIQRSDQARALLADIRAAQQSLQEASDGLSRAELEAEFMAADLAQVPGEQADTKSKLEQVIEQQNQVAAELNSARLALDRIAGQDIAARAESQRQEALARMANAAERYIKVYSAARLLRWAIEQYRESKQGPMLSRAGEIFFGLTLGAFSRLSVDYDSEPLALYGLRSSGEHVPIEGMSDGTRDQLFLALRLAAVELHLEQAPAMPFIADDLVINFDDARAKAGLQALARLSEMTQVIFLSHHEHLVPVAQSVFGSGLSVTRLM